MIFGECPYCEAPFTTVSPDETPAFEKITCEECGKWFWERHSRIDPRAYFPEDIEVNEETKTIKIKESSDGKT
jgi:uncharacterized protein with PIN domain